MVAVGGLALVGSMAVPPAGFELALIAFLRNIPRGLDGLWQFLCDLLVVLAAAVAVAAAVRSRWSLLRDLALAGAAAFGGSLLLARAIIGEWPAVWASLERAGPPAVFAAPRVALTTAMVFAAVPHLTRTARRMATWLVGMAVVSVAILGAATPGGAVASLLMAMGAAALVHLAFGSSRGRPGLDDVRAGLEGLGLRVRSLGAPDRQPTGWFLVNGEDQHGAPLFVKVYGRDAHDTQLLTTVWRTLWYREPGSPILSGRLQQVEHEAFLTLLAGQEGIVTSRVVTAGATVEDDVLLVLRPVGHPLADSPEQWDRALVDELWRAVARLHAAGITHGQLDDRHIVVAGEGVGVIDFRGGTVAPSVTRLRTDEAQALVTSVLAVGEGDGLQAAVEALGAEGVAAALPFVQANTLTRRQQSLVKQARLDLDGLRARAAEQVGVEAPPLERLKRVSWRSLLQVGLLIVAFTALARALAGFDLADLLDQFGNATWWLVLAGFLLAQLPRLSQAVSLLGASPAPLALGPVYALQLAQSYIGLALPSTAARVAVNIRFFQRQGVPAGTALAAGALDGVGGLVVQLTLVLGILLLTPASLELDFDASSAVGLVRLVAVVVAIGLVALGALFLVRRWRERILGWLRQLLTEAMNALRGLRSPRRLGRLLGGSLASELLFASALGAFVGSVGSFVGFGELVLTNVSVSLLAGLLPIPGGIGVVEGGLTFGLVRAGVPEEAAFTAVLMYRFATFYLPPIWGYFAFRWLERNSHL